MAKYVLTVVIEGPILYL